MTDETDKATTSKEVKDRVFQEIEDLKALASSFALEHIKDGSWFNRFVGSMLESYSREVTEKGGADYFRRTYPGYDTEGIVDKLIESAMRYATIAGGFSGAAASTAFAATIGTAGGAAVVAVPAGVTAIVAETFYTTRLQLRLVHDIATLYEIPIDSENLDDLYQIFCLAFGVKAATGVGVAAKKFGPEVARAHLRALIHGHTSAIRAVAIRALGPRLGREITQRAILRTAVPVAGVGISAGWNYASTRVIAGAARHRIATRARLRRPARELAEGLQGSSEHIPSVLKAIWELSGADEVRLPGEEEIFRMFVSTLAPDPGILEELERAITSDPEAAVAGLEAVRDQKVGETIARSLELVAAADGEVHPEEVRLLERYLEALGRDVDAERLAEEAKAFQPPESWVQHSVDFLSRTSRDGVEAARTAYEAVWSWSVWKGRGKPAVSEEALPEPEEVKAEEERRLLEKQSLLLHLEELHLAGVLSDEELAVKTRQVMAEL